MELKVRKRFHNGGSGHPVKRQKLAKPNLSEQTGKVAGPGGKFVEINDLAWKEVSLPDTLEDVEGFFGLEEIDDVEIVRDGDGMQYRVGKYFRSGLRRPQD